MKGRLRKKKKNWAEQAKIVQEFCGIVWELASTVCEEAKKCTVGFKVNTKGMVNYIALVCSFRKIEVYQSLAFPISKAAWVWSCYVEQ